MDVVDWARMGEAFRRIVERDRVVLHRGGRVWAVLAHSIGWTVL